MQLKGLILFFLSMLSVLLFLHYIRKKIGGVTGDTIGAVNEFSEAVILLLCIFYQSV
jgi:adenosylcobinamide-GDP ribazoletransferase